MQGKKCGNVSLDISFLYKIHHLGKDPRDKTRHANSARPPTENTSSHLHCTLRRTVQFQVKSFLMQMYTILITYFCHILSLIPPLRGAMAQAATGEHMGSVAVDRRDICCLSCLGHLLVVFLPHDMDIPGWLQAVHIKSNSHLQALWQGALLKESTCIFT